MPERARVYQMDAAAEPVYLGSATRPQLEINAEMPLRLAFEYESPLPFRGALDSWLGPASPAPSFLPDSACVREGWTVKEQAAKELGPYRLPLKPADRAIELGYAYRWPAAVLFGLLALWLWRRRDEVQLSLQREPAKAEVSSRDEAVRCDLWGRLWVNRRRLGDEVVLRVSLYGYQAESVRIPATALAGRRKLVWPPEAPLQLHPEVVAVSWQLTPGQTVAGYKVLERLGEGVSAVVYRVTQMDGTQLALKLLKPEEFRGQDVLPRFRREMTALARLRHPNVPFLVDFGEYRGMLYLCMELLPGHGLDEHSLPLPQAQAGQVLLQLARALDYAHKMGVLHRDVKPGNVVMGPDGQVKLTDFGLARSADSSTLTAEGSLLGTPAYIAPELVSGQAASPRSDQYSLACLAVEIFSGRPPYEGDSPLAVALQHVTAPPPDLEGVVWPELAAVLQSMLAKAPEDRPANLEPLICVLDSL